MRRAERGMTSVLGMMMLGIMLLAACGLLSTAVKDGKVKK